MDAQLQELVGFLRDKNPAVRQIALEHLLGHTPKESPSRSLFLSGLPNEPDVIRDLKILCRDQLATAHDAFRALVNLSDEPRLVPFMSERSFLTFLASYVIDPRAVCADLACMLLANLSGATGPAVATLITLTVPIAPGANPEDGGLAILARSGSCAAPAPRVNTQPRDLLALPLLVDAFVDGARSREAGAGRKGNLHFLSSVFANLSSTPSGRTALLTPSSADALRQNGCMEYPLAKIVVFSEHEDLIRRGGVASTIKNCAFNRDAHTAMLTADRESVIVPGQDTAAPGIDVLPRILLPLAGPEEFDAEDEEKLHPALQMLPADKRREPDGAVRLLLVEALILLCTTRAGRDALRAGGTYEIVRAVHLSEQEEKVSEHIERLVNLLQGDEAASVEDDDDSRIEEV